MNNNDYDVSPWFDDVGDDLDIPHYEELQTRVTCSDEKREEHYYE